MTDLQIEPEPEEIREQLKITPMAREWRREHATEGDQLMKTAHGMLGNRGPGGMTALDLAAVGALADMAAAHYIAAQVR